MLTLTMLACAAVFIQPNRQNKCWLSTFLQTTDILKTYHFFRLNFSFHVCSLVRFRLPNHLVRVGKRSCFQWKKPVFCLRKHSRRCPTVSSKTPGFEEQTRLEVVLRTPDKHPNWFHTYKCWNPSCLWLQHCPLYLWIWKSDHKTCNVNVIWCV